MVENALWPARREDVLRELRAHQEAGRQVLLVSGTFQPVLEAFAAKLGAEALGTPLALADGKLTGRLAAPVNVGATKAARLRAALGGAHLVAAYGDTEADRSMLELADAPVAVYPDEALLALAKVRGWRVLGRR